MKEFGIAIILLVAVSGGYRVYQHVVAPPFSAQGVASSVGSLYGDSRPQIVRLLSSTTDDARHDLMYSLVLRGHFRKGTQRATFLEFGALASRQYAWGLWASTGSPNLEARPVWRDNVVHLVGKNR
jgi:hypothetical protein